MPTRGQGRRDGRRSGAERRSGHCGRRAVRPRPRLQLALLDRLRILEHVAAAPDRLDVVLAAGGLGQLLAQLADEHVDDLELGLVHAAVEMVEEHLLGQRGALAQREQLQDAVFLAGDVQPPAVGLDRARVHVDQQLAGADDRFGVALRAPHDRLDPGDQLGLVERLGQVVVGTAHQAAHLVGRVAAAGQDQDRRLHLAPRAAAGPPRSRRCRAGAGRGR